MPTSPYQMACVVAGCALPARGRGRCAQHATVADQLRGLGSDRHHAWLYASPEWRRLRRRVLAASPVCRCASCLTSPVVRVTSVVHHIEPHHGDPAKFFDVENLVAMAKTCHDRLTGLTGGRLGKSSDGAGFRRRSAVSLGSRHLSRMGGPR